MNFFENFGLVITVLVHLGCYSAARECDGHQFQCDNGECVAMIKLCDGLMDCNDESDEKKCHSVDYPKCNIYYFQCVSDRRCIPINWRCDLEEDCADESDEENCSTAASCQSFQFACLEWEQCIYLYKRCDGQRDCRDGSDERYCETECLSGNIFCDDRSHCILPEWLCDDEKDCADGSDEKNCSNTPFPSIIPTTNLPSTTNSDNVPESDSTCPENYCPQNADCIVIKGQYHCKCSSSFTGEMCEIKIIDLSLVIGIAMSIFVLFIITGLVLFCCYKRRMARKSTALVSRSESQMPFTSYSKE